VFAGLVREFDDTAIDYNLLGKDNFTWEQNNVTAFTAAETKLGIPSILEAGMTLFSSLFFLHDLFSDFFCLLLFAISLLLFAWHFLFIQS
jgi:hypothetical protein